jgi:hypothetical protein
MWRENEFGDKSDFDEFCDAAEMTWKQPSNMRRSFLGTSDFQAFLIGKHMPFYRSKRRFDIVASSTVFYRFVISAKAGVQGHLVDGLR